MAAFFFSRVWVGFLDRALSRRTRSAEECTLFKLFTLMLMSIIGSLSRTSSFEWMAVPNRCASIIFRDEQSGVEALSMLCIYFVRVQDFQSIVAV